MNSQEGNMSLDYFLMHGGANERLPEFEHKYRMTKFMLSLPFQNFLNAKAI